MRIDSLVILENILGFLITWLGTGKIWQETSENGWYDLVSKGFIEYVDTEEEETTMISMTIAV